MNQENISRQNVLKPKDGQKIEIWEECPIRRRRKGKVEWDGLESEGQNG